MSESDQPKPAPQNQKLPPVEHRIIINFHKGGGVTCTYPTNAQLAGFMLGEAIKAMLNTFEYKEPSRIIQPPLGIKFNG